MIDIGCNLTNRKLRDSQELTHRVLKTSRVHGVSKIISIGLNIPESKESLAIANDYPDFVYATAGVHPHYAGEMDDEDWQTLTMLLDDPFIVAAGEMGLDYYRNFSAKSIQIEVFERQLETNRSFQKPLYLHERDAFSEQIAILSKFRNSFSAGVAHCFTGNTEMLRAYLDLGLHIGITGWLCDERRGKELLKAIKYIPKDRVLTETDSPYLLPRTLRPKPKDGINRPWYVSEIIKRIAECRHEQPQDVTQYTVNNAVKLFKLDLGDRHKGQAAGAIEKSRGND